MKHLAYCDYIATVVRRTMLVADDQSLIDVVSGIHLDLDKDGAFVSTKKTIDVTDMNGRKYLITVEEA
jgi:hypothetical protein